MGFSLVPATIVAMQGVRALAERRRIGPAQHLRLVGGALGLAVLSTIAASQTSAAIGSSGAALAATDGYSLAFHVGTVIALAGAAIAAFGLRDPGDTDVVRLPTTNNEEAEHEALAA